jgi:hypothetical protein
LINTHRLPRKPWISVSPTQSSVQMVSGSGLDSGSRLPKIPAATSMASTAKATRLVAIRNAPPAELAPSVGAARSSKAAALGLTATSARKLAATAAAPPSR